MRVRRWPALVLIPLLIVGAALLDDAGEPEGVEPTREQVSDAAMPVVASEGASSTWYCGAGSGSGDEVVSKQTLVMANTTDDVRRGTVTAFPDEGDPVSREVEVAPRSRATLDSSELTDARFAGVLVEFEGDGVAVSEVVEGQWGEGAAECVSSVAERWYLAAGTTVRGAHLVYYVLNPFPDNAVLDITFDTDEGIRNPQPFQGLVVPGSSTIALNIGEVVTRYESVSASVRARTGRVVVDRVQAYDGTEGPKGLAVAPASPAPAETSFFPSYPAGEGMSERYVLYNPGEETAEVDLQVIVDDPAANGSVAPIEVTVPGGGHLAVGSGDELWAAVQGGVGHSVVVRSQNGVPVVVDRRLIVGEPAAPGVALDTGTPVVSTSWVVPTGTLDGAAETGLAIVNPYTDSIARVTVRILVDGEEVELVTQEIPQGERAWIDLGRATDRANAVVLVEGRTPIVPDIDYRLTEPDDRALVRAVPIAGTTETLAPFTTD